VRLAQELATSVSYVHTFKFVHKNICPESVLLFQEGEGGEQRGLGVDGGGAAVVATASSKRSCFLIGFESFRSAAGDTSLLGDGDWAHNIYRHPERMGEFPAEAYRMQHDIYSLGVCLLEIGLWEPLVEYAGWDASSEPEYGRVCRDFVATNRPWVLFKDYLVELAESELPRRMGDRYAEVVVTCLTCLDRDGNFGDESEVADADGILVGVRFIETIFGQLKEIVL
jgi:serine/threonine protein kinase